MINIDNLEHGATVKIMLQSSSGELGSFTGILSKPLRRVEVSGLEHKKLMSWKLLNGSYKLIDITKNEVIKENSFFD